MLGDEVQIFGVIHHDGRVLATTFQNHLLQVGIRRIAKEPPTGLGRSREGHHVDAGVKSNRLASTGTGAGHDVQNAARHTCFHRQLGNTKCRERCLFRRLHHH